MRYMVTNDHGHSRVAESIEGALCYAVLFMYVGDKAKQDAKTALKKGATASITYGFKTVTIEPVDEYCLGDERYYANE